MEVWGSQSFLNSIEDGQFHGSSGSSPRDCQCYTDRILNHSPVKYQHSRACELRFDADLASCAPDYVGVQWAFLETDGVL